MARPIRLTYIAADGETVTEECLLVDEEDDLYTKEGRRTTAPGFEKTVEAFMATGQVVFADENGLFLLPTDRVIHIELLQ